MKLPINALISYEGKVWDICFGTYTDQDHINIVDGDRGSRPATEKDGDFMDVLMYGKVITKD